MTAREAAAAKAGAEPWRITRGHPDAAETAAVLAVLRALLAGQAGERPEPPRARAAGWDRTGGFRRAGTWRER
ncbi:acyl-CoA carboxylase epsilon subunit [Streptomyces sp. NBC_01233]|uniref:acyl-CoA carboxylase epsilon subunit n=1 Tax=Streptomyces sp. NBC_01233 TaxID=2903787 RepID=UPI002E10D672|nr:acyl-CoA carboxylase subunit epsilon [Streptomyces sp. NBC_01233]WSP95248.1 acyl-CoA carboxylase subunit epsilon [Streptomyces sp. NBC_01233]